MLEVIRTHDEPQNPYIPLFLREELYGIPSGRKKSEIKYVSTFFEVPSTPQTNPGSAS